MNATFVHDGCSIPHTPTGGDVLAGDVVVIGATLITVAKVPIANNTLGAVATEGVFEFTKAQNLTVGAGNTTYWDAANGTATGVSNGTIKIGPAIAAAGATDTTVKALLRPN